MTYKFNGHNLDLSFTYKEAKKIFPVQFGLKFLSIFEEPELFEQTTKHVMLDESIQEKLLIYFLEKNNKPHTEEQLDDILSPSLLADFAEEFWKCVVNFSSPLKRQALTEMWKYLKMEMLSLTAKAFQNEPSTDASSTSQSEQDSNPGTTQ